MQSGKQPNSRTYSDYESTILALEGMAPLSSFQFPHMPFFPALFICILLCPTNILQLIPPGIIRIYESKLKQLNPNVRDITYDVQDLHAYIDHLEDLCCLMLACR